VKQAPSSAPAKNPPGYGNCVTVMVVLSTVIVPTRLSPVVFGFTVYVKFGEAEVANDFDTVIQSTFDLIVHAHPAGAIVFMTNVVPAARIPTFVVWSVTDPGIKLAVMLWFLSTIRT
jgi:hypothetical protein